MSNIVSGADGVTSASPTRQFTSTSSDFVGAGAQPGDILHVVDPITHPGDNNRYKILVVTTTVLTIDRDWPEGNNTSLIFRVQSFVAQFGSNDDVDSLKTMDAEAHRHLFRNVEKYWILNQLTSPERNIYGEPKILTPTTGADGATSAPATRQFTSAGTDFVSLGIRPLEIIRIAATGTPGDDGDYEIVSVDGANQVTINQDWPSGSLSSLDFEVLNVRHEYDPFGSPVPMYVLFDPPQDQIKKWGLDETRDFLALASIELLDQLGLTPKIGDRFDAWSEGKLQQFQILTLDKVDMIHQDPLHYLMTGIKPTYKFTES